MDELLEKPKLAVSLKPLAQSMVNFEVKSVKLFCTFITVYV